jgi:hypothetical protein
MSTHRGRVLHVNQPASPSKCMGKIPFSGVTFRETKTRKLWIHRIVVVAFCNNSVYSQFSCFGHMKSWYPKKVFTPCILRDLEPRPWKFTCNTRALWVDICNAGSFRIIDKIEEDNMIMRALYFCQFIRLCNRFTPKSIHVRSEYHDGALRKVTI